MADVRIGRQTPTKSVTLPYEDTHGQEAIDLYNSTGRTAQPWQELLMYDILAVNEDGLWVHTKFGYSVPRRNGKNEVVVIREMHGITHGEKILHTAHRTTTSAAASRRLAAQLSAAGYVEVSRVKKGEGYRARELGIVEGVGGGLFEPDRAVTRAEAAAMMVRLYDLLKK